jgi:hypothetical protein
MAALRSVGRLTVVVALALGALAGLARAAVEDYVPADAVAILKVQDPMAQFDKIRSGPLFQKLQDPAFAPELAAGIEKVRQGISAFEAQQGVNLHQIATDLLGREVALVAMPNDLGAGIIEGRDAKSLQSGLDGFLDLQRASGDLTAESTSTYKGVTIDSGMQRQGQRFHAVSGDVLVVSNKIEAVQKVIDVIKGAPALSGTARYKQAMAVLKGAPVTGFLNGDALEPLAQMLAATGGPMRPAPAWNQIVRTRLAESLQQVDYGVLSVQGDGGLTARLTFAFRDGRIPQAVQSALPPEGSRMDVLGLAPQSCVLAAARSFSPKGAWDLAVQQAGQINPAFGDRLNMLLDDAVNVIGGVYTREQLFSELGDQVGVFILPGPQGGYPAGALAIQLRQTTHIPDALATLVGTGIVAARSKGTDITVESPKYHDVQLTTVRVKRPGPLEKLSPTFGVVDGNLIAASTLEAAKDVVDAALSKSAPPMEAPGTPVAMVAISVPQVRELLTRYHEFLVTQTAAKGQSRQKAEADLAAFDKALQLLKGVRVTTSYEPGRTNTILKIDLAAGL